MDTCIFCINSNSSSKLFNCSNHIYHGNGIDLFRWLPNEVFNFDDNQETIFINGSTIINEGEVNFDGIYIRYIVEREINDESFFSIIYVNIE